MQGPKVRNGEAKPLRVHATTRRVPPHFRAKAAPLAAQRHQMLMAATVTLNPKKAVFEQSVLQVDFELLADEMGKMTAAALNCLDEARILLGNGGIQYRLFGTMPAVGVCGLDAS